MHDVHWRRFIYSSIHDDYLEEEKKKDFLLLGVVADAGVVVEGLVGDPLPLLLLASDEFITELLDVKPAPFMIPPKVLRVTPLF